jgi:dTDP-4-dehydrorhamnose reductase
MNRVLVLGSAGFVGNHLIQHLQQDFEVLAGIHKNEYSGAYRGEGAVIDITRSKNIESAIYHFKPECIVNLVACSSVAECQKNREQAYNLNVAGARNAARISKRYNMRLIHFSTDMVFDGKKGDYTEEDDPDPMTVYARTKYQGDAAVLSLGTNTLVIRPSLVYGRPDGKSHSFSDWLEKGFVKKRKMKLFKDQYRTPIYVKDLCSLIKTAICSRLTGILNAAGNQKVDRVEFARLYSKTRGYDEDCISEIAIKEVKSDFYLQKDLSLVNKKAKSEFNFKFTSLKIAFRQIGMDYSKAEV